MVQIFVCVTALSLLLGAPPAKSQEYDICIEALTSSVFNPATTSERACRRGFYCIANPGCCTPGCLAVPDCVIVRQIERTYDYIRRGDDLHCFGGDAAAHLYENWRAGTISFALDSTTGGALTPIVEFLKTDVEAIYRDATPLPQSVKNLLEEIISPVHDGGETGYAYEDIEDVRITFGGSRFDTGLWLRRGAITLGNVIIVQRNTFNSLVNANTQLTMREVVEGQATQNVTQALRLLGHEMVHVKQYRVLGDNEFFENYVLANFPVITDGYGFGPFEQEAYRFDVDITEMHGGIYCADNANRVNGNLTRFRVDRPLMVCDFTQMESITMAVIL